LKHLEFENLFNGKLFFVLFLFESIFTVIIIHWKKFQIKQICTTTICLLIYIYIYI